MVRRAVLAAGVLALVAGTWLLAELSFSLVVKAALCLIWIGDGFVGLRALRRGASRIRCLKIDASGGFVALGPCGERLPARLLTGTMVQPQFAWFRMRLPDGSRYCELLLAKRQAHEQWHRLQLIWAQCRESFGHTGAA